MLWSKTFVPTLRDDPQEAESAAHRLMLRSGLVRMLVAGVYSYLPLGFKVLNNIENIIRQEMNARGAQEILLPGLQPQELWDKSGRNAQMEEVMIRFVDRRGRKMCLGPTHEEVVTTLAGANINSYKQLPMILYQIQTKYRDEIRPRFGLVRSCEFIMKDAYSFDTSEGGLDKNYKLMYEAYVAIFRRLGLECVVTEADSGIMGGEISHEFMVLSDSGEDAVSVCGGCGFASTGKPGACPKCATELVNKKAIEIGHIFKLGIKYSQPLGAVFVDDKGTRQPIIMGCYGIGVSRLVSAIIESNHDEAGIVWPPEVAPYDCELVPLNVSDSGTMAVSFKIYDELNRRGINVILDDRDERAGVKLKDADLIGIPLRIIIGTQALKNNEAEIKLRFARESSKVKLEDVPQEAGRILKEGRKNNDQRA